MNLEWSFLEGAIERVTAEFHQFCTITNTRKDRSIESKYISNGFISSIVFLVSMRITGFSR